MKSFIDLIQEVHKKGICQQCGGCVSFCNSIEHEVIGFKEPDAPPTYLNKDKCLQCGICYLICPQTHELEEELNKAYKFSNFRSMPLGFYYNLYSCQSTDSDFLTHGTDGGVVNTLINFLLEKEYIDGAIVAKTISPFSREAVIAKNKKDLLEASGMKLDLSHLLDKVQKLHTYTNSLPKLKQLQFKKLLVVGTPCQIYTIRCMQNLGIMPSQNIDICFGLFCYENFTFDRTKVKQFEKDFEIKFEDIKKINIKEDLIVHLKEKDEYKEPIHIPFDQLELYMRSACNACSDFTNIYADVSFGGLGSPEKFTTILTRTEKGRDIIFKAIKANTIKCSRMKVFTKEQMKALLIQYSISKVNRKESYFKC